MGRRLEEYTHEELIEYIKTLKKQKRFGLVWEDTPENVVRECEPKLPGVTEVAEKRIENALGEPTNIIIEGDNYHALSVLNYTHAGKIDVIYIDPPYNTGNKDFIYNDCYVDKEDTFRHSKWLSFMEKRLRLAKSLLADDGVIFISIDDNEQVNLRLLCDAIFGDDNFLACLVVNSAPAGTQSATDFAIQHSYCLVYRKSKAYSVNFIKLSDDEVEKKYSFGEDELGKYYIERIWKRGIGGRMEDVPSLHFPVWYNPETNQIVIDEEIDSCDSTKFVKIIPYQTVGVLGRWTWSREKMRAERDHLIVTKIAGEWKLHKKVYANDDKGKTPYSIIGSKIGRTELGSLEIKNIFNEKVFDYPKYSGFIKYLVSLHEDSGGVILDFFAGSGTTGQAVMELNKEDGGHRQFILVTNNEANGQADAGTEGIAEKVTYPRIKTVITGIRSDGTKYSDGIPANLRYFKTDFVEKGKTTDDTREALITECCDMIRIRENSFEHVASAPEYRFYKNDKVFVPIIFDQFAIAETWELVEKLNTEKLPVHCYNFSYNRHANEEEIPEDTKLEWMACSIPESVLEVYKRIFRKKEN